MGSRCNCWSSTWFTHAMPSPISTSDGNKRDHASGASTRAPGAARRRFEVIAITTGKVPMIIVGNGPPARWIALARNR